MHPLAIRHQAMTFRVGCCRCLARMLSCTATKLPLGSVLRVLACQGGQALLRSFGTSMMVKCRASRATSCSIFSGDRPIYAWTPPAAGKSGIVTIEGDGAIVAIR